MPGMVMFRRRWSVGSDDLVLPALFLFLLHCIWWVLKPLTLYLYCQNACCFSRFLWLHVFIPSPQVGGSVRGPVRPSVRLRTVVFRHAGGPWPGLLGHPGQLPHLRERHHVAEHERQHSVHAAEGSGAVCHLYTARWASASSLWAVVLTGSALVRLFCGLNTVSIDRAHWSLLLSLPPPSLILAQPFSWWSWCTPWWELPGSCSITSRALMSLPKTWL